MHSFVRRTPSTAHPAPEGLEAPIRVRDHG